MACQENAPLRHIQSPLAITIIIVITLVMIINISVAILIHCHCHNCAILCCLRYFPQVSFLIEWLYLFSAPTLNIFFWANFQISPLIFNFPALFPSACLPYSPQLSFLIDWLLARAFPFLTAPTSCSIPTLFQHWTALYHTVVQYNIL